jgi:D-alanyl-D-alanine carboxypeptidase (penicillin-binding protein 5/6)
VPTFDDLDVEGSKVGLVERVGYPVHELFSALMMVSGNDAGERPRLGGGRSAGDAALMNEKARSLRALDTARGQPARPGRRRPGQLLVRPRAHRPRRDGRPDFAAYAAARKGSVSAPGSARIEMYTKNKLLKNYEGALGIKNGYTSRARASFVGAAERDGRRLVVTLMKADPKVWAEAGKLLDWGFAATGDVEPVGELVDAEPTVEEKAVEVAEESLGAGAARSPAPPRRPGSARPWPAWGSPRAALLAVRHRPGPATPPRAPARSQVPAQRPLPQRVPVRR